MPSTTSIVSDRSVTGLACLLYCCVSNNSSNRRSSPGLASTTATHTQAAHRSHNEQQSAASSTTTMCYSMLAWFKKNRICILMHSERCFKDGTCSLWQSKQVSSFCRNSLSDTDYFHRSFTFSWVNAKAAMVNVLLQSPVSPSWSGPEPKSNKFSHPNSSSKFVHTLLPRDTMRKRGLCCHPVSVR